MANDLRDVLIQREGYSLRSAEMTAADLSDIKDTDLSQALSRWLETGEKTNVSRGSFSCAELMQSYKMKYPAALVFLDWYSEDPETAQAALCFGGGE